MNIWNIHLNCGRKISVLLSRTSFSVLKRTYRPVVRITSTSSRGLLEWRAYISTLQLYNHHPLKHNSFLVVEMWLGSQKAKWCLATVISWIREKTPFHGCTLERAYSTLGHLFDKRVTKGRKSVAMFVRKHEIVVKIHKKNFNPLRILLNVTLLYYNQTKQGVFRTNFHTSKKKRSLISLIALSFIVPLDLHFVYIDTGPTA